MNDKLGLQLLGLERTQEQIATMHALTLSPEWREFIAMLREYQLVQATVSARDPANVNSNCIRLGKLELVQDIATLHELTRAALSDIKADEKRAQ